MLTTVNAILSVLSVVSLSLNIVVLVLLLKRGHNNG